MKLCQLAMTNKIFSQKFLGATSNQCFNLKVAKAMFKSLCLDCPLRVCETKPTSLNYPALAKSYS